MRRTLRTLVVTALKGGSGKTTVASHLALAAFWRGVDTLVVDIDPQHSISDLLAAREQAGPACIVSTGPKLLAAKFAAVGLGKQLMIIDTPAAMVEDVSEAIVLADYAVLVVRPTLLDISGLVRTYRMVRRLGKPCAVVVNQAPVPREGSEAPLVKRALKGLDYMGAPLAPVIVRSRNIYQTALERGLSAEETNDKAAAQDIAALWDFVWAEISATPDTAGVSPEMAQAAAILGSGEGPA